MAPGVMGMALTVRGGVWKRTSCGRFTSDATSLETKLLLQQQRGRDVSSQTLVPYTAWDRDLQRKQRWVDVGRGAARDDALRHQRVLALGILIDGEGEGMS